MVYSLLSMLGTHDKDDMSRTLLAMSSSQDSCIAMRQSGCLPLLIQLLHGSDKDSLLLGNGADGHGFCSLFNVKGNCKVLFGSHSVLVKSCLGLIKSFEHFCVDFDKSSSRFL